MKKKGLRLWTIVALLTWGTAQASFAVDIASIAPVASSVKSLPTAVDGLACDGAKTKSVRVAVKGSGGQLRAHPLVAVLRSPAWSPDDAERDGASEFEVLMCAARLVKNNQLPGIVGIGNSRGAFLPGTETALQRIVHMGVPVVRLASRGQLRANPGDLFIEGGSLSSDEARVVLAECLLRHGSLSPAGDPTHPSEHELAQIRQKVSLYQQSFDLRSSARMASLTKHSKIGDWSCSEG